MTTKAKTEAWAVISPENEMLWFSRYQGGAILQQLNIYCNEGPDFDPWWKELQDRGYRCVKVRVEEV